jgi:uncharacterized damage-inducible protein DinB
MTLSETLLPEFDQEMAITRRVIERVPTDKGAWKPHEKSFSLGHLAQLVATMPGWLIHMIDGKNINLSETDGYSLQPTETLLAQFDKLVAGAREKIAGAGDADFTLPWSLMMGERAVWTASRWEVVRNTINHLVHHRGQLTVYLRLIDVPVPSTYGPSADEKMF